MVEREIAEIVKAGSLYAVAALGKTLQEIQGKCSDEDFAIIKRGTGRTIGRIQLEILDYIYYQHPDLSHLV